MKINNALTLNIAAAVLVAFINPVATAAEVTVVPCELYPVERYAPHETSVKERAITCVAEFAGIREEQVSVMAVDFDNDKVLVTITLSNSTKTVLVTDKEVSL